MRIRARRTVINFFMMPRGSEDADPGAQNRYQFFMMPRGSEDADPGAQNLIGALLLF